MPSCSMDASISVVWCSAMLEALNAALAPAAAHTKDSCVFGVGCIAAVASPAASKGGSGAGWRCRCKTCPLIPVMQTSGSSARRGHHRTLLSSTKWLQLSSFEAFAKQSERMPTPQPNDTARCTPTSPKPPPAATKQPIYVSIQSLWCKVM